MRREIKWGFLNSVGADLVAVMQVDDESAELLICHEDAPAREERVWVAIRKTINVDSKRWQLVSAHEMGDIPEGAPPGTGSGRLVAVIEQEADSVGER